MEKNRLKAYKNLSDPLPETYYKWPLFGEGFGNLGVDGKPVETKMPEIKPNELLLRIDALGLCFSDVKVINLGNKHSRIFGRDMAAEPVVLGHETSVTVIKVGDERKNGFKPGQRYVIQPDVYYKGIPVTFGYCIEGALQQYVVVGDEVIDGDEGCYLMKIKDTDGYAETALLEPWSCVEAAYGITFRNSMKNDGIAWIAGTDNARSDQYDIDGLFDIGNHPKKIVTTNIKGKFYEMLYKLSGVIGFDLEDAAGSGTPLELSEKYTTGNGFDDIIVLGTPSPEFVEDSSRVLANGGIYAFVSDVPIDRKVSIDVGRIHYDGIYYTGTKSVKIANAYNQNKIRDIRAGGKIWLAGAGGPLGQMHTQRAVGMPGGPVTIIATDIDTQRINELKSRFTGSASARGALFSSYNTKEIDIAAFENLLYEKCGAGKLDDVIILAPVPQLIEQGADWLGENGVMNIFAGITKGSYVKLEISNCYMKNQRWVGNSGTSIAYMLDVLKKTQNKKLFPNHSVAAIGGLNAAYQGLEAVKSSAFAGKVVIFPQMPDMPLIAINKLHKDFPNVAKKLEDDRFWSKEAEDELIKSQWRK